MNLSDGFLDELRTRLSLAQVVGRKVTWDPRKSNQGKGDFWAPCPFHTEKSASFHVDDPKGFYYCFGCQAKGDAINFVRETENVGFMEAVEILAREVGMSLPKRDPQAQKKSDQRGKLTKLMEAAVKFYQLQLKTKIATPARSYLERRGLTTETLAQFEIGFAADSRNGVFLHLSNKGATPEDIIATGMCIEPDQGGTPYDRFRDRIMFPIRDARGRCIAFGGRAMQENARAKYLNSPETVLFDKGRNLYNLAPARAASGKADALIVAEGYMDVIALSQAGFAYSVAPLGTAITEDQLQLMWRVHSEPVIALDGDKAGLNAALRLMDLALPILEAGKSLRFALMPSGQDPDDLIQSSGSQAMQAILDQAQPMVQLLWQRETAGKVFDSPERRAALDIRLRHLLNQFTDKRLRSHYAAEIAEKRRVLFRPADGGYRTRSNWQKPRKAAAGHDTKSSLLAQQSLSPEAQARVRESVLLMAALLAPAAALEVETDLERCHFQNTDLEEIRTCLLAELQKHLSEGELPGEHRLSTLLKDKLGYDPMEKLRRLQPVKMHPHLQETADPVQVRLVLLEELSKQIAVRGAQQEIDDAMSDMEGLADEGLTWRLKQATLAREKATRSVVSGTGNEDSDGQDMSDYLQKLIEDQIWIKKKR